MKITYELSIELLRAHAGALEILKGVLYRLGVKEHQMVELKDFDKNFLVLYFQERKAAQSLVSKLRKLKLKRIVIRFKAVKQSQWQNKWRKDFKPFVLTPRFKVIPLEFKLKHITRKEPIYLEPGLAFGTGLHATTHFMVQFIERCEGRFKTFLDIGTGTGILSIIAAKCAAQVVDAIDISRDAISAAKQNFKNNKCRWRYLKAINLSHFHPPTRYDFVAANLITQDLIDFRRKIISQVNDGKYLAVSGISLHNYSRFRSADYSRHLRCLKVERKEDWVGILYQKTGRL